MNEKKIAVIIPVYNVEKKLVKKCVESIMAQTYKSIEIIIVDDGNEKDYAEFLNDFQNYDERISVCKHETNMGLYQARLTGVENSNSDYIAFVDADDTVSLDWFRLLVCKAECDKADIVMANTICEDENGWRYIFNRNQSVCNRDMLEGKEIFSYLVKDCGLDFSNHTVWNKLYSRELWEKAWNDLNRVKQHLIMTEDIMFSFVLFYYAERMSFSNHDGYFYYRNAQSSTINTNGIKKCKKNVEDLECVFGTVTSFLHDKGVLEEYKEYWEEWKCRYFRWWSNTVKNTCQSEEDGTEEIKKKFFECFSKSDFEFARPQDAYFDEKRTTWNNAFENIKGAIASDECKVVSFDMFDTLIVRPVLYPEDVYEFVCDDVNIYPYEKNIIKKYRRMAEENARREMKQRYPQYEDVTLSEIYEMMEKMFDVPSSLCEKLKNQEIAVEYEFAIRRKAGAELYELARYLGKTIYITSDMYLELDDINKMLAKNGYKGHTKVLLSSNERLLKATGNLFELLIKESACEPSEIIHIGDNWNVDAVLPTTKGIRTFFIAKTKDILFNYLGDVYTGESIGRAVDNTESIIDFSKYFESLSVRCMYAVSGNVLFDNPYVSYDPNSDYNGNPYYVGCIALGMHMLGLSKWLLELAKTNKYETIHFSSRDGYYLKKIFDTIIAQIPDTEVNTNYLYISRKAFIPIEIRKKEFISRIISSCSFSVNSPYSIMERYNKVLLPLSEELEEKYKDAGFFVNRKFSTESEFIKFINLMGQYQYSDEKAAIEFGICKEYLSSNIGKKDIVFDLGYSGKLHKDIIAALDYQVDGAYVSKDGYDALQRIDENNMTIYSYYDFIPSMQGIVNEYILSDREPSCIGYENIGGKIYPKLEEKMKDYVGDYVINEINRGAMRFASEFAKNYANRMNSIRLQPLDASLQYEKFLVNAKYADRCIFDCCVIEDEFYGGIKEMPLNEIWNWQVENRKLTDTKHVSVRKEFVDRVVEKCPDNLEYEVYKKRMADKSKVKKGLYWLSVDSDFFKKRVRATFKK